ncbi:potassium-transporting ATPase, C subunit [Beutenbergia cavernae DSM 12333]|uniref:Potassium-transporting ATPase KdpC subunit n=1 Tax=Beutenbergia cavernae (strain ATCC BAA-8 / DSM 12333 / CCUG 43141 / JCM 11478 / NBRC 16432 / NCIMB 13614 / HKI 0122) TaxID=471853 RepID=C5C3W3_BEUC1|nr:potassium-transporting ATPase subunit KdpC [Beutenbergia cavernae]ACQ82022.1 potassium-transporting ATPase, C subunit [Beutenbergia cavernae DSM 12333]
MASSDSAPAVQPSGAGTLVALVRQSWAGLRVLLLATVVLGLIYPLTVTGIGQVVFPWQANGSLVRSDGTHANAVDSDGDDGAPVVGSVLIGQAFGAPGESPEWFHGRPSAAGEGYDTLASAGSNLGPNNPDLVAMIEERRAAVAAEDGVDPASVPPDALTASGSGLDPHISPAYALQQVNRVAEARGLTSDQVRAIVDEALAGRVLGVLGEERVNVLELNLALVRLG